MKIVLIPVLAIIYSFAFLANNYVTSMLYLAKAAHLVHIPTGIKLFYVLIFGWIGVIAIFISNLYLSLTGFFESQYMLSVWVSVATSVVPMLCVIFTKYFYDVDDNFFNVSPKILFNISVLYSILNSIAIQLLIHIFEKSNSLVDGIFVMFIGDMTGITLVALILIYSPKLINKIKK
jgi:hypothetical protein